MAIKTVFVSNVMKASEGISFWSGMMEYSVCVWFILIYFLFDYDGWIRGFPWRVKIKFIHWSKQIKILKDLYYLHQ